MPGRPSRFVAGFTVEDLVVILAAGRTHPRFDDVVERLLRGLAQALCAREPKLASFAEDAAARAIFNVMQPECLAGLREPAKFEGYAITAASRELNDLARREGRERDERDTLRSRADKERQLANSLPFIGRSAGELAEISEELDRALQIIAGSPVTWAKIIDDLPEKEITRRTGLNHNQIQGIVRRVLEKTRKALDKPDDPGTSGGTLRPAATHSRRVGPPRDEGV